MALRKISLSDGKWIRVQRIQRGVYELISHNFITPQMAHDEKWDIAYDSWDAEVENLDRSSDVMSIKMSEHLRWKEVDLTPERFHAPSLRRLTEALGHVKIKAYPKGDI